MKVSSGFRSLVFTLSDSGYYACPKDMPGMTMKGDYITATHDFLEHVTDDSGLVGEAIAYGAMHHFRIGENKYGTNAAFDRGRHFTYHMFEAQESIKDPASTLPEQVATEYTEYLDAATQEEHQLAKEFALGAISHFKDELPYAENDKEAEYWLDNKSRWEKSVANHWLVGLKIAQSLTSHLSSDRIWAMWLELSNEVRFALDPHSHVQGTEFELRGDWKHGFTLLLSCNDKTCSEYRDPDENYCDQCNEDIRLAQEEAERERY